MDRHVVKLCRLADLPPGRSRGFSLSLASRREDIFLVRTHAGVFAYRNSCPHTGGPLDWTPDRFLNLDGDLIQCATHNALFRIEDGLCVKGPCSGQSLSALEVEISGGRIYVGVEASGDE
jgi:nitrite reductase/ring-hydroxylating ferredoxin subunit